MIRVNLKSVYTVVHYTVPHMIAQRGGRIVALSFGGRRSAATALHSHYAATKGGIISFVKAWRWSSRAHNILVNCVAPGFVDTDMSAPVLKTKRG